jgi:RNA polymerase sigma factor (TIGR02999 family)
MTTRSWVRRQLARAPRQAPQGPCKAPARFGPGVEAREDRRGQAVLAVHSTADTASDGDLSVPSMNEVSSMNEVTRLLTAVEQGEDQAASQLLPLVYDELRRLAAQKLAHENPGQTLSATALVHEAYLRLVGGDEEPHWGSRGHFFAAAAEAMRRILVEHARRKASRKRGGDRARADLDVGQLAAPELREDLLALDEALDQLAAADPEAARLVQLRYFAGLTLAEAAQVLGISARTADRLWAYARAWLHQVLEGGE